MIGANPLVAQQLKLSLGSIVFSVASENSVGLTVSPAHRAFLVSEGEPDIALRACLGAVPALELEEELFRTRGVWGLYRNGGKLVLRFCAEELDSAPYKIAVMEPDFSAGTVYTRVKESGQGTCFNPLNYPLDELLVINFLSLGRGMVVHACGVEYQGRGWLFAGTSGAGKTTLARLWQGQAGVSLLSDDRIVIRETSEGCHIYGTPWHGDARIAAPLGAPLEGIFFLAHGRENRLTPLPIADAARRLLVRCFPAFWSADGMEYTLGLCERLARHVPCYQLDFTPDSRVIDLLRGLA